MPILIGFSSNKQAISNFSPILAKLFLCLSKTSESSSSVLNSTLFGCLNVAFAILPTISANPALSLPRCGVPKNTTPIVSSYIAPSRALCPLFKYSEDLINPSLITSPPRLCPTNINGREDVLRRKRAMSFRRFSAWLKMLFWLENSLRYAMPES